MYESRSYRPSFLLMIFVIACSVASCVPHMGLAAPKQERRCLVIVGATWCGPCQAIKKEVLPVCQAAGLRVSDLSAKANADIHLVSLDHDPDPRPGWGIAKEDIPVAVVFEGSQQVDIRYGQLSADDIYRLLKRDDLLPKAEPPQSIEPASPGTLAEQSDEGSLITTDCDAARLQPVSATEQTIWDQINEMLGCDTVRLTVNFPGGRTINLSEARAVIKLPETLIANVKRDGESIAIKFDEPLIKAEATRLGVRVGTVIPSATVRRDEAIFQTGFGYPLHWKLVSHPFGQGTDGHTDAASDAAGETHATPQD